jgi:2,3-bisphosphoglycerate-dependent phosphoglycerate mutase
MSRLLVVRHCESSGQAGEAPLTAKGYAQAEALAERLAPHRIDRIVSSSYRRAQETIAPFAARAGLPIELEPRLVERRLSPAPIDDWKDVVRRSFGEPDFSVPGGESGRQTLERGWAALSEVLDAGHALPVIVSHGQLISLLFSRIDPAFGYDGWQSLQNPDVHLVERDPRGLLSFRRLPP